MSKGQIFHGQEVSQSANDLLAPARRGRHSALFLDRDGVINIDRGYVHCIEDFEFLPSIFDLVRYAVHGLRWPVIVITNQAGIARGLYDEPAYFSLTEWMCDRFRAEGAPLTKVYHCPYHPTLGVGRYRVDHDWRKPRPGMILQAAADFNLSLPESMLIGDKNSDIEAAAAAGIVERVKIDSQGARPAPTVPAHRVLQNLGQALTILQERYSASSSVAR
jgi:D-glycero-D-manno-heptose 1,7-bisphosphate phosphatase